MKVLFANKFFFLNGGSERVFFLEREFLLKQGIPVIDFSMQDERNFQSAYAESFVSHVDYHRKSRLLEKARQAASFIRSSESLHRLGDLVDREKPNIAHLHNIYHQITPSIIPLLKKKNVKVVLTLHDCKLICPSYLMLNKGRICEACHGRDFFKAFTCHCQDSILNGFLLAAEGYWHSLFRSYESVDLFIPSSAFLAELVVRYRLPREKIVVLGNAIDTERLQPTYEDRGYGLYFGRLSKEKGLNTLLEAYGKLKTKRPFKIVGTGPLEDELKRRSSNVEFLGFKTGNDLMDIISGAAFVVVPSEWYENCSNVVLEAMALGKPVIASRIGGLPEQIEDGKTGFLFQMGDHDELAEKMQTLWMDANLRKSMGYASRLKLESEFSLKKHGSELLRIYRSLVSQ